ncbi:hypothetical protein DXT88_11895 [Herbaspirillum lusitanum]|nr:hypothetical protein [Herbaspirillum lusitanum]
MPAFSLDLAELDLLWQRLLKLFDGDGYLHSEITINLNRSESLSFNSVEEIKDYKLVASSASDFTLSISKGGKSIRLMTSLSFFNRAVVLARGEDEAWCAGGIEVVVSFLQNHKCWYRMLALMPFGVLLVIMTNLPTVLGIYKDGNKISTFMFVAWILILVVFGILAVFRNKFFPSGRLIFTREENVVKRYSAEITLAIAVFAAVVAALSWLMPMK